MVDEAEVSKHYSTQDLFQRIGDAFGQEERELSHLSVADISRVDQFHVGGAAATQLVAEALAPLEGKRVLDVGCGLGGPARLLASQTGCQVSGIDLSADYIEVGNRLTELVGLGGQVELHQGSALDLKMDSCQFEAAYMMHVGMNIDRKATLMGEAFRVLQSGKFVVYDIMRLKDDQIRYPVPWADRKEESAVDDCEVYEAALQGAGFVVETKQLLRDFSLEFLESMMRSNAQSGLQPVGLHLLMGQTASIKIKNMYEQIKEGLLTPTLLVARKGR